MRKARVTGQVVSTVKDPGLHGLKLHIIETIDSDKPEVLVAADATRQAGVGDLVFVMEAKEAGMVFSPEKPLDATICGFIDYD